ncbi:hypothetical protein [Streptomyces sp. NPDC002599]
MTSMTHDGRQITGGVDTHGLTHHAAREHQRPYLSPDQQHYRLTA